MAIMFRGTHRFVGKPYLEIIGCSPADYHIDTFMVSGSIRALLRGTPEEYYEETVRSLVNKPIVNYKGVAVGNIINVDLNNDLWTGRIENIEE